jgi:acyl-CoA thioester hydrolase
MPFPDFNDFDITDEEILADLFHPAPAPTPYRPAEEPFAIQIAVRGYELDSYGHLNRAVYLQYAEHARWECLRAAGVEPADLLAAGLGPVTLEETIRYHRELRAGQQVAVSCAAVWGAGKTFALDQEFRLAEGVPVAELTGVCGLMDLEKRRLVDRPAERWRSLAKFPERLGLASASAEDVAKAHAVAERRKLRAE